MKDLSKEKQHDIILYVNKYFYIIRGNRWDELLNMPFGYKRLEIIKALSKYYEYQDYIDQYSKSIDLDHTNKQKEFREWVREHGLWKVPKSKVKKYSLDYIIKSINKYDIEKRYFLLYLLTTGLRVREAHYSIKHHNEVCDGKIISLNWSRGHKKTYDTFCIIHDLVDKIKVGKTTWFYYYHYNEDKLKFPLRYLRKVNFTLTSMYVNPIIAKYIQGRMLNTIDMANYFIPMLDEFYDKYRNYWDKIIERIMS